VWAQTRLADAREAHRKAVEAAESASQEFNDGSLPSPDGSLAFRNALVAERLALKEYMDAVIELNVVLLQRK
jgi:hypothetical protein